MRACFLTPDRRLSHTVVMRKDFVIVEGEMGKEMYIIETGTLRWCWHGLIKAFTLWVLVQLVETSWFFSC